MHQVNFTLYGIVKHYSEFEQTDANHPFFPSKTAPGYQTKMVLKHLDDTQGQSPQGDKHHFLPTLTGEESGDGSTSYQVLGLASDQHSTPTGMRDEILLLSWMIVLLRTREDGEVRYDWAYKGRATRNDELEQVNNTLSTDQVMPNLQTNIQRVAEAITHHVAKSPPSEFKAATNPASLLLSTGPLSQTHEGSRNEVSGMVHDYMI